VATNNDIRFCLEFALSSITGLPPIVNENLNSYPQDPTAHLATKLVPTSRRAVTMGENPYTNKIGFMQVLIRVPLNEGTGEALDYADTIETFFGPSTYFTTAKLGRSLQMDFTNQLYAFDSTTTTVVIDYAEASSSFEESPYYCTPVNIGWHCNNL
jgi:Bacteriophage related domain of unknown function